MSVSIKEQAPHGYLGNRCISDSLQRVPSLDLGRHECRTDLQDMLSPVT